MANQADQTRILAEVEAFAAGNGESGRILSVIAAAKAGEVAGDGSSGWTGKRVDDNIKLYGHLLNMARALNTQPQKKVIDAIDGLKGKYSIYDTLAGGFEAVRTLADYMNAAENSVLTEEKVNSYRALLIEQLSDLKKGFDDIRAFDPDSKEAAELNQYISKDAMKSLSVGPSGRMTDAYADVEISLAGLKNGWPIEDLEALSAFNTCRYNLNYGKEVQGDDFDKYRNRMNNLADRVLNGKLIDDAQRKQILGEMKELITEGVDKNWMTYRFDDDPRNALNQALDAALPSFELDALNMNTNGKIPFWQDEHLDAAAKFKNLTSNFNFFYISESQNYLSEEDKNHYQQVNATLVSAQKALFEVPSINDIQGYVAGEEKIVTGNRNFTVNISLGSVEKEIPAKSLATGIDTTITMSIDILPTAREYFSWIGSKYQEMADKYTGPKYAGFREYLEAEAKTYAQTDGNFLEAMNNAPYAFEMFALISGTPRFEKYPLDDLIDKLNQTDKPAGERQPIFDQYMKLMASPHKELQAEYHRQQMEREGWTPEKEQIYLKELKEAHEYTLSAFDFFWNVKDEGQYDDYLNNNLETICGKKKNGLRDKSFQAGMIRAELKAIENGWGSRDVHLVGYIGGIDQEIQRSLAQLTLELHKAQDALEEAGKIEDQTEREKAVGKAAKEIEEINNRIGELDEFEREFHETTDPIMTEKVTSNEQKHRLMERFSYFVKKHQNDDNTMMRGVKNYLPLFEKQYHALEQAAKQELAANPGSLQEAKADVLAEQTRDRLMRLARAGKYRELIELFSKLSYDERDGQVEAQTGLRAGVDLFIQDITALGPNNVILPENTPILTGIMRACGYIRQEVTLEKANAMEEMEQSIYRREVQGTEDLVDDPANRQLIREIADSQVALASPLNRKHLAVSAFISSINLAIGQVDDVLDYNPENHAKIELDGKLTDASESLLDFVDAGRKEFRAKHPEITTEQWNAKSKRADLFVSKVGKYGFEIDPDAKKGESIFRKRPEKPLLYQQAMIEKQKTGEREKRNEGFRSAKPNRQDQFLPIAVNAFKTQIQRVFPGNTALTHYKDSKKSYPLLFPAEKPEDYNNSNPVYHAKNIEVDNERKKGFVVKDQQMLAEYKTQMANYADRVEDEIDDFTKNFGEAGKTLATITKARTSGILKNALNGWSSARIGHVFSLRASLERFHDITELNEKTVKNITNSKEGYPVYEAIASGYEALQTMVDYMDAGEKGTLTAQKENELRVDLYRQLKAAKQGLDIIKNTTPGTAAYREKEKLLSGGIWEFSYGRSGGVRNLFADVEARLAGVENGWPIEDLSALAWFNATRHQLITHAYYKEDGSPRKEPVFEPEEEAGSKRAYLEKMNAMFEKLQNTPVLDASRRTVLLNEMSEIMKEGVRQEILTDTAVISAADRLGKQKSAKLSPVAMEKLGINAEGKLIFERHEGANLVYNINKNSGNIEVLKSGSFLSKDQTEHLQNEENNVRDLADISHPDLERFATWDKSRNMIKGAVRNVAVTGLLHNEPGEGGHPESDLQAGRNFVKLMHDLWLEQAGKIDKPEFAKFKEYFELQGVANDPDGNYLGALADAPYMANLMSETTSLPKIHKMPMDKIIAGLNKDKSNPLYESYMDIVSSGLRELKVEFHRQKMERRGFSEEDEKTYLSELKAEHEKTIAAYEKIWNTVDEKQYDDFIDDPLSTVCGKESANARDISFEVGQLRGELQAIENGWGSRDLHLFGFIGGVEQETKRYMAQLDTEMQNAVKEVEEANKEQDRSKRETRLQKLNANIMGIAGRMTDLTNFTSEFRAMKDKVWNVKVKNSLDKMRVMAQFQEFVEKHADMRPVSKVTNIQRDAYDRMLNNLKRSAADEAYRQMKACVADGDYAKLAEMLTRIEAGEFIQNQPQEIRASMDRFLEELAAPGADGLIPPENAEVFERIAGQLGNNLTGVMLQKADELGQMEDKVYKGQVPGMETLLGYEHKGLDDQKEIIRDIVNNFVDQTGPAAKEERKIRQVMSRIGATLQAGAGNGQPMFMSGENRLNAKEAVGKSFEDGQRFGDYKGGKLTEQEFKQKIARASEKPGDISKYGYEIDPDAKGDRIVFSKVPEDVRQVMKAQSPEMVEKHYNTTLDKGLWLAGYRRKLEEVAAEATMQLEKLEKMTQIKKNSAEYNAMHDALKEVANLGKTADDLTPEQVEKAFNDLKNAGGDYENTHKGLFKGNIGSGRQRFNFSREIQTFAIDNGMAVSKYGRDIGIDRSSTIGEQLQRNAEAIKRAKNANNAQNAQNTQNAVKDVSVENLEQKLGEKAGRPRIDYAALRAKLYKMQQEPQLQGQAKNSNGLNM